MKNVFENWMNTKKESIKKESTARGYADAIDKLSRHYSKQINLEFDFYFKGDEIESLIPFYDKGGKYEEEGNYGKRTSINALKALNEFNKYIKQNPEYLKDVLIEEIINSNFTYEQDLKSAISKQIPELFPDFRIFKDNKGIEYPLKGSKGNKRIDILLENKNNGSLLILELKAGIEKYDVVGQVCMYLSMLKEEMPNKEIYACIIVGEISQELALAAKNIEQLELKTYSIKINLN